ncbi:hypothetical protein [Winogradskyella sp. SYSU M77433]|uniref:hypothetical protein n=1 Tax=Winogradskyella sp. SYSU M77433 TaxID=3042722 RepID=UPI0024807D08|nr:hypothetical protein [Winogradskyella sp. SYSU M77433]MDH7914207.1 hypothetical protein [Winogradskyella sp. SYSU M77433]
MGIKLGSYGQKPEYNTDEYLEKFIPLVIKHAPKYDNFSISDLKSDLNLSKNDQLIFSDLTFKIRQHFINNDIAEMYGSRQIKLLDKGRDIKNGNEKIFGVIINNDFSNSTIGTVIQESDLKKARIISNPKTENNTPLKKSLIQKLLSNPWFIGIVLAIVAAILNTERIMNFINNVINKF